MPFTGTPVRALVLGGKRDCKDKLFAALGSRVVGISRKGKHFFTMETNLADSFNAIFVEDASLWTLSDRLLTLFEDGREAAVYASPERLLALTCVAVGAPGARLTALIGCADACVRAIAGGVVVGVLRLADAPTALALLPQTSSGAPDAGFAFGTASGAVGLATLSASVGELTMRLGACTPSAGAGCAVTTLAVVDVLGLAGAVQLVAGRSDGRLVLLSAAGGLGASELTRVCEAEEGEALLAVDCGHVTSESARQLLVATFAGKIVAYTLFRTQADAPAAGAGAGDFDRALQVQALASALPEPPSAAEAAKAQSAEYEGLRRKLVELRFHVREAERKQQDSPTAVALGPTVSMAAELALAPGEAYHVLSVELSLPLFTVAVQASIGLTLRAADERCRVVPSPADPAGGWAVVANLMPAAPDQRRIEVLVRCPEGRAGVLRVTGIPRDGKPRMARIVTLPLRPLALHERMHDPPPPDSVATSSLVFTGAFSIADAHAWLLALVPGVPDRAPAEAAVYAFHSRFLGTRLQCAYQAGRVVFASDSLSALAIVKDAVMREATARKIAVELESTIREASVANALARVRPRLEYLLSLEASVRVLDALTELQQSEADAGAGAAPVGSLLTDEQARLLADAATLRRDHKSLADTLGFLTGVLIDLYIDAARFAGRDGRVRAADIGPLLLAEGFRFEQLETLFASATR